MHRTMYLSLILAVAAAPAFADCGLKLSDARILPPPPGTATLGGYATIDNTTDAPVTISGASSEDFASVDFHQSMEMSGMMHMMHMPSMTIPPHGTLSLVPGDYHLMLSGPKRKLAPGDSVTLKLLCGANSQSASFPVKAP